MSASIRILIADDSEAVRKAIRALVVDEPKIKVCGEARDYAELLQMITDVAPEVVLLDLRMPNAEVFDAATIKAQFHGLCMLAMSFAKDEETASLAKEYGAFRLLDKIDLASTLIPAIDECLAQSKKAQA
jgi:chemotaxis response regulator CheB